jgi:hypothetical protein
MENSLSNNIQDAEKIKNQNEYVLNISEEILRLVKFFDISEEINQELQIKPKNFNDIDEEYINKRKKKDVKEEKPKKKKEKSEYYNQDTQFLVEKPDEYEEEIEVENGEEYIEEEFILDDNVIEDLIQPINNDNENK